MKLKLRIKPRALDQTCGKVIKKQILLYVLYMLSIYFSSQILLHRQLIEHGSCHGSPKVIFNFFWYSTFHSILNETFTEIEKNK